MCQKELSSFDNNCIKTTSFAQNTVKDIGATGVTSFCSFTSKYFICVILIPSRELLLAHPQ
jgi:hypothetical protein